MNYGIKINDMNMLAEYQVKLREQPCLRDLFFELTDKCNLQCRHCGSSCKSSNVRFIGFDIVCRVLRSVAESYDPKEIMICLTGGEPMLYPRIYEIINVAKRYGFAVGITSNGTLIDDSAAMKLMRCGLDTIAISLDGIGKTHDRLRGVDGSFDMAVNGIKSLKKAGIEPQVVTVVHKGNKDQLDLVYEYLKDIDVYSWRVVNVEPIGRASDNSELLLDAREIIDLYEFIRNKRFDNDNDMEVTYACSHFVGLDYEREIRDFYFQCGAGTTVASVCANGDITACLDIERRSDLIQGNVYKDDFVDVWEHRFREFREDRSLKSDVCKECSKRDICMGDSAHTWNFDTNEPNYCVSKMMDEYWRKEVDRKKELCPECSQFYEKDTDKYCRYCGAKRGKGFQMKDVLSKNVALYGPPVRRWYKCTACGNKWSYSFPGGLKRQSYCPKCGHAAQIESEVIGKWL